MDDFLPSYLESIGNLRFLGTKHGLSHIRRFISDLENHIDFIPGDDQITNTNNKAFNVSSYVANVLSGIENATVVAITGHNRHNNISQCIRQAFKVLSSNSLSLPQISLSLFFLPSPSRVLFLPLVSPSPPFPSPSPLPHPHPHPHPHPPLDLFLFNRLNQSSPSFNCHSFIFSVINQSVRIRHAV